MEISSDQTCQIREGVSLIEFITENWDTFNDNIAVIDSTTGKSYTYSQIRTLSRKLASALIRSGLKKGDVVAVYSPNVPEYPIIFFGALLAGGIMATCNPLYTASELSHLLQLSESKYLFSYYAFMDKATEAAKKCNIANVYSLAGPSNGVMSLQGLLKDDGSCFIDIPINPYEDIAILPFSSGTTGLPKGVMLTHHSIICNVCQASVKPFFAIEEFDTILALLPWFHIYGMVTILFISFRSGATVISMPRFQPQPFLEAIQDHKITIAPIVPPIAVFLTKHPLVNNYNLSSLRNVITAAAPLSKDIQAALGKRLGVKISQGYGMTELSPVATITPLNDIVSGSVGKLVPNTKAKVVDVESGKDLAIGKTGELCFKGPQVMKGYLKNKEATDRTIDKDGWLHTGDIGYVNEGKNFFIVDRLKELIKYKGFQVAPAELEALLLTHEAVLDAAVIGVPDEEAGELPKAFIVKKKDLSEQDVIDFVASQVGPHKKLRGGVEFIKEIPKSASGKILRRQLKEKH